MLSNMFAEWRRGVSNFQWSGDCRVLPETSISQPNPTQQDAIEDVADRPRSTSWLLGDFGYERRQTCCPNTLGRMLFVSPSLTQAAAQGWRAASRTEPLQMCSACSRRSGGGLEWQEASRPSNSVAVAEFPVCLCSTIWSISFRNTQLPET